MENAKKIKVPVEFLADSILLHCTLKAVVEHIAEYPDLPVSHFQAHLKKCLDLSTRLDSAIESSGDGWITSGDSA